MSEGCLLLATLAKSPYSTQQEPIRGASICFVLGDSPVKLTKCGLELNNKALHSIFKKK